MAKTPVAEFVSQNRSDLLGVTLFDQGIVDDNVLLPRHAKEVGVAVRAALAAINHKQFSQGKLEARGEVLNRSLEIAGFQRSKLVEQGCNGNGPDRDHEHLKTSAEHPEVVEELLASLLNNGEESSQDGRRQNNGKGHVLETIGDEQLGRFLVEAKLLLQDKRVVDRGGRRQNLVDKGKGQDKDDRVRDFTGEARGREAEEQVASP